MERENCEEKLYFLLFQVFSLGTFDAEAVIRGDPRQSNLSSNNNPNLGCYLFYILLGTKHSGPLHGFSTFQRQILYNSHSLHIYRSSQISSQLNHRLDRFWISLKLYLCGFYILRRAFSCIGLSLLFFMVGEIYLKIALIKIILNKMNIIF